MKVSDFETEQANTTPDQKIKLSVNGRFLTRPATGVDRVAAELVRALLDLTMDQDFAPNIELSIIVPAKSEVVENGPLDDIKDRLTINSGGRLNGHLWEQFELPRLSSGTFLLNLCNTGPIISREQLVMIHDAQVFLSKDAYSRSFRTVYRQLLPRLARRAALTATVSDFSRQQLEAHGVTPQGGATIIHNGCDHIDRLKPDPETLKKFELDGAPYILALGSLAPHKNLKILHSIAAKRGDDAPEIVVAGGGNLRVFADTGLGNAPGIRFIGRVTDSELKTLYSHAMAFAFPSITEGFGLPPVEAMRCNTPVVASDGGAIPEVCGDAVLYADPFSEYAWSEALQKIASDADLRGSLVERGRVRSEMFTWRHSALTLLETLSQLPDTERAQEKVSC